MEDVFVMDVDQQKIIDMAAEEYEKFKNTSENDVYTSIETACKTAQYVPQLLEIIQELKKENKSLFRSNDNLIDQLALTIECLDEKD
ncbi:hypothetical protein [Niallia sp. 03190]|uniref:hypothetical protein n=1 Tax=Niallia sp. 03190 TaxID=3458061 RepID=UPI00404483DD